MCQYLNSWLALFRQMKVQMGINTAALLVCILWALSTLQKEDITPCVKLVNLKRSEERVIGCLLPWISIDVCACVCVRVCMHRHSVCGWTVCDQCCLVEWNISAYSQSSINECKSHTFEFLL